MFALTEDAGFVPVALAKAYRFLEGADTLPSVQGVVYMADVHVEFESRKPTCAFLYGFFKYKLGRDGRWDPAHKQDADHAWGDLISSLSPPGKPPHEDGVVGGDRFAKRRVDVQHR